MQPAPHRLGRHHDPPPGPHLQGNRSTAPAGATPAASPRRGPENCQHRPSQGGGQPRPPGSGTPPAFLLLPPLQVPGPVGPHHAVDGGARTEQDGGNLRGRASGSAQQEQVQGQQVPISGPAQLSQHAALLSRGNFHYRCSWHRRSSQITQMVSQPLMYPRVCLCANLLWSDLAGAHRRGGRLPWHSLLFSANDDKLPDSQTAELSARYRYTTVHKETNHRIV